MIMMIRRHIRSIAGGAANVAPAVLCALCVLSYCVSHPDVTAAHLKTRPRRLS